MRVVDQLVLRKQVEVVGANSRGRRKKEEALVFRGAIEVEEEGRRPT